MIPTNSLSEGFVYLDTIDPTIQSSLRYLGEDNFTGQHVDGYLSSRVIMTKVAAEALHKAQSLFQEQGYSLVVYDAYRPQTAVNCFIRWSDNEADQKMKAQYYPNIDKCKAFELGYIARKSGHSRGSTADVTLISNKNILQKVVSIPRTLKNNVEIYFLDDGTLDMGSSFDLFDEASHLESSLINEDYARNRAILRETMEACGFRPYDKEWWHFTLNNEPFPDTYFDFPVK